MHLCLEKEFAEHGPSAVAAAEEEEWDDLSAQRELGCSNTQNE